jgi:hypothetical protein
MIIWILLVLFIPLSLTYLGLKLGTFISHAEIKNFKEVFFVSTTLTYISLFFLLAIMSNTPYYLQSNLLITVLLLILLPFLVLMITNYLFLFKLFNLKKKESITLSTSLGVLTHSGILLFVLMILAYSLIPFPDYHGHGHRPYCYPYTNAFEIAINESIAYNESVPTYPMCLEENESISSDELLFANVDSISFECFENSLLCDGPDAELEVTSDSITAREYIPFFEGLVTCEETNARYGCLIQIHIN